jgi:hypothetical protein
MALFSKDYHPLDSRNPRNRVGAQAGTYGVQTATSKVRATPVSKAQANDDQASPVPIRPKRTGAKMSQIEQMNALVAETQARASERAQDRARQPQTASPFSPSTAQRATTAPQTNPVGKRQRSKISKGFQILANIDRNIRIGMLIAFAIYILTNPDLRSGLTSLAINGGPSGSIQSMPSYSSNF